MRELWITEVCKKLLEFSLQTQHRYNGPGQDCGLELRAENAEAKEGVPMKTFRNKSEDWSGLSALNNPKAGSDT